MACMYLVMHNNIIISVHSPKAIITISSLYYIAEMIGVYTYIRHHDQLALQ